MTVDLEEGRVGPTPPHGGRDGLELEASPWSLFHKCERAVLERFLTVLLKDDLFYGGGEVGRDLRHLFGGDLTRAGSEDEAEGVCAEFCGQGGVSEVRVGADLDPHKSLPIEMQRGRAGCAPPAEDH